MPRIGDGRPPAEPSSPEQQERYQRMLRAAASIGSQNPLERVQMQEVAKAADVAIATLYRYFPSKTHLFAAVLHARVDRLEADYPGPRPGETPGEAVARLLVVASRKLLQRPVLAQSMLQSNSAAFSTRAEGAVTSSFHHLILRAAGVTEPDGLHLQLVRLIEQAWYGVLISSLNGHTTIEQAEDDLARACQLLLAPLDPT